MYAQRTSSGFNPGSLGLAIGINVVLMGALLYANPGIVERVLPEPPITMIDILPPVTPPPEPVPETKAEVAPRSVERVVVPETVVRTDPVAPAWPAVPPGPPVAIDGGVIGGTGTATIVDPPKPPPVLLGPQVDPRYADGFQPAYPPGERRMGNEGRVVVRVLVGTDGRVKQVERVSATSDAFFRATQDRALSRWRFRPGTRDGTPVEAWRTMSLTFVLNAE